MNRWIKDFAPQILDLVELKDWGDLKLLLTHYKLGHLTEVNDIQKFITELKNQKVINNELEITNWTEGGNS
jgi:hypothetical protein